MMRSAASRLANALPHPLTIVASGLECAMRGQDKGIIRRDLMKSAVLVAAAPSAFTILGTTAKGAGRRLKVGLVGCGFRGNGALKQHVAAGKLLDLSIEVVATADYFKERAERTGKVHGVPAERCFGGATGYRELIEAEPDIVLLATPPLFRPVHFEACVQAGKHVVMEKPVAVDPPGCRRVRAAGELAEAKGLVVVAGTNLRHEKRRIDAHHAVTRERALGELKCGRIGFCIGHVFSREPKNPKTADDLITSWQLWRELGGDHIVDMAIHHIELAHWFIRRPPASAVGFGGRARRRAGNIYDSFSVDFDYGDGVHVHGFCRQMDGCWQWADLDLVYEKGRTNTLRNLGTRKVIQPKASPVPADMPQVRSSLAQVQVRLLYHIARGRPFNQAKHAAESTATAILGRESAYGGKQVTWQNMMEDPKREPELYNLARRPTAQDFETGDVVIPKEGVVPIPGRSAGA